jgi:hypothetical protein
MGQTKDPILSAVGQFPDQHDQGVAPMGPSWNLRDLVSEDEEVFQ